MSLTEQTYWAEYAWLNGPVEPGVVISTSRTGHISSVAPGAAEPPVGCVPLRGLTLPGLANVHSHAFHRALRSATQVGSGTFWTWRNAMYDIASRLDPDLCHALARAVYAEMALAGVTCVGEFHYVHHAAGGTRYGNQNAMGEALIAAAADAGIRMTLLDTCYLAAGFGQEPTGVQLRFSDGTAARWAERADALRGNGTTRIGAAIHSVRAVPAGELAQVAAWAEERGAPLHVHLSEQPKENEDCLGAHGRTPAELLADHGVLGPRTTAVHATHLTGEDIELLGRSATVVCLCPTTERDLADGIGPAARLRAAGSPLCLGSDSHAVIDLLAEARALELHERLNTRVRGHFTADQLLRFTAEDGHAALGWPEAGRIEPGCLADFTTVALDSVRTAGPPPRMALQAAVFAATGADVRHTVVGGRHIVRDGGHQLVPNVPAALAESVAALRAAR
ncbi:formimidoylglutamate deiminase [Streptomyces sp. MP131-18]|uniref:formimidoylglutamate deiminase n=1 Tax=Streptomyces sp. MP131-18 TaxID=1857892 RepID=UPI00097C975A|nr:formimidoylglutamate deiminase [Streptomyces sp. MP131-18]ONK13833.1 8-oxoguanine deaminase [Streptomyces sp. MP131-18]